MGLSKLAKKCRECPFKDKCKNKRMEEHGLLEMKSFEEKYAGVSHTDSTSVNSILHTENQSSIVIDSSSVSDVFEHVFSKIYLMQ